MDAVSIGVIDVLCLIKASHNASTVGIEQCPLLIEPGRTVRMDLKTEIAPVRREIGQRTGRIRRVSRRVLSRAVTPDTIHVDRVESISVVAVPLLIAVSKQVKDVLTSV